MIEKPPTLNFDLTGFPYARAFALVSRRSRPRWIAFVGTFGWAAIFGALAITVNVLPIGVAGIVIFGFACGSLALFITHRFAIKEAYRSFAESPCRSGWRQVAIDDTGLTLSAAMGNWHYPWSHILDVIAGSECVLALIGKHEYIPIPASAFANAASVDAFVAAAKANLPVPNGATL